MRNLCTLPVSLSVLVCLLTCSAQAGTTVQCLENALPMETLGDDAGQRDTLLSQAEACMREAKPPERYRRFYRGNQVEARLCLCLLQPGLG